MARVYGEWSNVGGVEDRKRAFTREGTPTVVGLGDHDPEEPLSEAWKYYLGLSLAVRRDRGRGRRRLGYFLHL